MNTLQTFPPIEPSADFQGSDGRKLRIDKRTRDAIKLMVFKGDTRAEAAEAVGLKDTSLRLALKKQHIKAYQMGLMREMRTRAGQRAYLKLTKLSEEAASEHVQMESSKWVAGVEGISPVSKHEVNHSGSVAVSVGYIIDMSGSKPGDNARDVTPHDMQSGEPE